MMAAVLPTSRNKGAAQSRLHFDKPVLGFAAWSGTGKTSLLVRLLPLLRLQGLRVGMIKHAHHAFDIDTPGKDSYELRKAGANQVLVASDQRWALMGENETVADPDLDTLLSRLDSREIDLVLVEGFRHLAFDKIELHRPSLGKPLMFPQDDSIIAVASDTGIDTGGLPLLNLNHVEEIGGFINRWLSRKLAVGSWQ